MTFADAEPLVSLLPYLVSVLPWSQYCPLASVQHHGIHQPLLINTPNQVSDGSGLMLFPLPSIASFCVQGCDLAVWLRPERSMVLYPPHLSLSLEATLLQRGMVINFEHKLAFRTPSDNEEPITKKIIINYLSSLNYSVLYPVKSKAAQLMTFKPSLQEITLERRIFLRPCRNIETCTDTLTHTHKHTHTHTHLN